MGMGLRKLKLKLQAATIIIAILLEASFLVLEATRPLRLQAPQPLQPPSPPYKYVFAFGDSTTDTGNALLSGTGSAAGIPPYGSTYFRRPTGRFSDGRLIVDRLCQWLGVPLLQPHLATNPVIRASENYAVAGATSLNVSRLQLIASVSSTTVYSLAAQVNWFLRDIERLRLSREDLANSLVYFGEIGGNDYNYALLERRWPPLVASLRLVSPVIAELATQLERILQTGVRRIVIQGQFPMGCLPAYNGHGALDNRGCVAEISAMSNHHNSLLRQTLRVVEARHPDVSFIFLDTTAAYLHILSQAQSFGFLNLHEPCFNHVNGQVCPNPNVFMSFDGVHMTDAMYGALFSLFIQPRSPFSSPNPNFLNIN